jgi:hypothetical protein
VSLKVNYFRPWMLVGCAWLAVCGVARYDAAISTLTP